LKTLILDANILIRGVLGAILLTRYIEDTDFFAPDVAFDEAQEHLPGILEGRGVNSEVTSAMWDSLRRLVQLVERDTYAAFETVARERLIHRDPEDWPILATALALRCAIWTEDNDFFGCGFATWTTDRVEIYMRESEA
jgi:predicted nucleic acid-binding protein